ncbi:MAG: imidazole glycerol phosphate synthase subunit HisH [Acidimicrobiia bacterium]|nr:imidazole glycerol phosphate synthase subunit HisH [Acidimicrobiia bacterium]MDH3397442.1 imidazole glycerol phosphate synthase subunit HisH [Acidimicrobiia bacterium]MDH5615812.1 imidazole glycerol phosphate synthase subunit HisH [Acidimicrobiia bacterium]
MTRIAVIDHGAGNLVSIAQGLQDRGARVVIAVAPADLAGMDGIVLPGVGATGAAMDRIRAAGLVEPLTEWHGPLLGICVGLQLFFTTSEEDGGQTLGLIPGTVRRLVSAPRLPHIGWNDLRMRADPLFVGIPDGSTFYFVHSFAPVPEDSAAVIATCSYGSEFVAAVRSANRVGVQFHPERSGPAGLRILGNFMQECRESADAA